MNIVLIGYRCSGKTSLARELALRLARKSLDTDELVERRKGKSIDSLVAEGGWDLFRRLEGEVIGEAAEFDDMIIAAGGGSVLDPCNARLLKKNGWVVWLKASPEELRSRMKKDEKSGKIRPSLTQQGSLEEIRSVLEKRESVYQSLCDFTVDTTKKSTDKVAGEIEAAMKQYVGKK